MTKRDQLVCVLTLIPRFADVLAEIGFAKCKACDAPFAIGVEVHFIRSHRGNRNREAKQGHLVVQNMKPGIFDAHNVGIPKDGDPRARFRVEAQERSISREAAVLIAFSRRPRWILAIPSERSYCGR